MDVDESSSTPAVTQSEITDNVSVPLGSLPFIVQTPADTTLDLAQLAPSLSSRAYRNVIGGM